MITSAATAPQAHAHTLTGVHGPIHSLIAHLNEDTYSIPTCMHIYPYIAFLTHTHTQAQRRTYTDKYTSAFCEHRVTETCLTTDQGHRQAHFSHKQSMVHPYSHLNG